MFYEAIDFAVMYRTHKQKTDFKGKKSEDWDARSKEMAPSMQNSPYVNDFISRMQIKREDTVLDIGCGPGTLAIPLAKKVKHVIAVDFSKKMLEELEAYAAKEGIKNITTYHIGWEDDWSVLPKADICVASRSVEVADMEQALLKMSRQAKKACYLTSKVGGSYIDLSILDYIGKMITLKPDFWYIPLILYRNGYLPTVDYIHTNKGSIKTVSKEAFVQSLEWSVGGLNDEQRQKAREYYDLFVITKTQEPKPFDWAFIGWKTKKDI
jgi:SAM-dependent methyltransferase